MHTYSFSEGGTVLTIHDGHLVPKAKFQSTLNSIKAIHGNMPIFRRTDLNLRRQWAVNNFLHRFDKNERFLSVYTPGCAYNIFGWFCLFFIK